MINKYFPKTFVINLDHRTDRWAFCQHECEEHSIEVERVSGLYTPKEHHYGCTTSHRRVIRQIANGPWERALVLEDDFKVVTEEDLHMGGFDGTPAWDCFHSIHGVTLNERFEALMPFLPDKWDVLYLGGGYQENPISRLNEHIIRCAGMLTTTGYGITRKFAKTWTKLADKKGDETVHLGPIDVLFSSFARDYLYYITQPRLIYQRHSKSDITGTWNTYIQSMLDWTHEQMV